LFFGNISFGGVFVGGDSLETGLTENRWIMPISACAVKSEKTKTETHAADIIAARYGYRHETNRRTKH
jgi:hypothetical protein